MTKTAFSTRRTDPYGPPAAHRRLLAEEPIAQLEWTERGGDVWTVAKYEDVRAMLGNTSFSSDRSHPLHPGHMAYNPRSHPGRIIEMDPPAHAAQRGRVMGEFTVKKISAMRPRIEEIVNQSIDAMLASGNSGDFVELLALPVPSMVIADLLNVPESDYAFFQEKAGIFADGLENMEKRQQASSDIVDYIATLVDARIAAPGDDVLSRQLAAGAPREEAIGLGHLLLIAGHETTSNMISLAVMTLLDKPELRQQLAEQPELIPGAVEELLRYFTIAETGGLRLAVEDIELRGVTIPSGSVVAALTNTANRDPDVFPEPDRIDFTRGARNHVAFGFGPHQCLGQNVARLELVVVLEILFTRLPELALAVPVSELPLKEYSNFGIHTMPVAW
ncbi:cytochrome P450 [Leucobacter luti]|uniref:Cytochrome P450 n=1 Tax=Leucobacter luti TaxID=340320 RepID=A0A4V6MD72_9MICO|nr:cytochrome P450 [Leucobacter luti]MBL3699547.1 cytochrome P450 [Leucobacter luti]RZT67059.1 cytochrome P450 [Leucobacter luti]